MVHVGLEGGGGVAKAEEHYGGFVEPEGGGESHLPSVFGVDEDIIVPPSDIKLGEDFAVLEFIYDLRYER